MRKFEVSDIYLKPWQRVACAIAAVFTFYNYLWPWPQSEQDQFVMGFCGVVAWSLMAIFGNKVRGARLLALLAILFFLAAFAHSHLA